MVSATCSIVKGDFPVEIVWQFNGNPIDFGNDDITITRINKHMSAVSIESVAARHAGEYTCMAKNKAGIASHATTLAVNGINKISNAFNLSYPRFKSTIIKSHLVNNAQAFVALSLIKAHLCFDSNYITSILYLTDPFINVEPEHSHTYHLSSVFN